VILQKLFLSFLVLLMIVSCSDSKEKDKQNAVERITERIANDAVSSIKTPIEKAKLAKEMVENHNSRVKEAEK